MVDSNISKRLLVGIRTNKWDFQTFYLASYYRSFGLAVVAVVDETQSEVNTGVFPKISMTKAWLQDNHLRIDEPRLGWLCGDYFFYVMRKNYPDYDGYWLVEDDALIIHDKLKELLFRCFEQPTDFMAMRFNKKSSSWRWTDSVKSLLKVKEVEGCMFPMVFASGRFCDKALESRQQLSEKFSNCKDLGLLYPNDESFMMNFMDKKEFIYRKLEDIYGKLLTAKFRSSSQKHLYTFEADFDLSNKEVFGFYHPVVIKQSFFDSFFRQIRMLNRHNIVLENGLTESELYKKKILEEINGFSDTYLKSSRKKRYLIALYSSSWGEQALLMAEYYKSFGITVVALVDETKGAVNVGGFDKVSINAMEAIKYGSNGSLDDINKNYRDFYLYALLKKYPDFDGYWVFNDSTFIKHKKVLSFLNKCFASPLDFAAMGFSDNSEYNLIKQLLKNYNDFNYIFCSLNIFFISSRLCRKLLEKRTELVQETNHNANKLAIDSRFMMSFIHHKDFVYMPLEDLYGRRFTKYYREGNFLNLYLLSKDLKSNKLYGDGIYYPVMLKPKYKIGFLQDTKEKLLALKGNNSKA